MEFLKNPNKLPFVCGGLGLVGLALRYWLLLSGPDDKGLLNPAHPARFLTALVTGLAIAAVIAAIWGKEDLRRSKGMFPPSRLSALVAAAVCVGLALSAWGDLSEAASRLDKVTGLVGLLAAAAAVFFGWCRLRGLRPHFLAGSVIAGYLMLHVLRQYQQWFSEPQLMLYLPRLLGHVLLMLACYHKTALEASLGGRKMYIITSQLAGFFCLTAVAGGENPLFYLTMAAWMLLDARDLSLPLGSCEEAV